MKTIKMQLHKGNMSSIASKAYYLLAVSILFSCSKIKQDEPVMPKDPFETPISLIRMSADSTGTSEISISELHINQSKAFTISAKGFKFGDIELKDQSTLQYRVRLNQKWSSDSGEVEVCQQGNRCKNGFIKVMNINKKTLPEVPLSSEIKWLKGTALPDLPVVVVAELTLKNIQNLNGMAEIGSTIDSIWGFFHTADIISNQKVIRYFPGGGIANGLGLVNDRIFYRIKRPNGQFYRGMIPILIGDPCQPKARQDEILVPNSGGFIDYTRLSPNDTGCLNLAARPIVNMRLEVKPYLGNRTIKTQFGTIQDSLGSFYYKRIMNVEFPDTTDYFMAEGDLQKISVARLIIKKQ